MTRKTLRLMVILLVVALIASFFAFDLHGQLTLAHLKARAEEITSYSAQHPFRAASIYAVLYIVATALSLPVATLLTLTGGAVFGLLTGTVLVIFSATIGATFSFWIARFIARDFVQEKFGDRIAPVNRGVRRDGGFYLLTLRLLPAVPYAAVNLLMGLTPIRTWKFFLVSLVGMLPGTFVYVNAGTRLGQLESLRGIASPELLGSFALLAIFPWIARAILNFVRARRAYRGFKRPRTYDYNLAVIGAGSAGLVSAYIAATVKAKVALIEKHRMGGDCLNTGCVPSKALLRSARAAHERRQGSRFGLRDPGTGDAFVDFPAVMKRVREVIERIEPHDSVERYTSLGADCIAGTARLKSPWELEIVDGSSVRSITARSIIVATGASPRVPDLPGLSDCGYLTSDTVWSLRELPRRLLILGGGPIGCELAQAFVRLGSEVTQVERGERLMSREDPEVSARLTEHLRAEGVQVLPRHEALRFERTGVSKTLVCASLDGSGQPAAEVRLEFDEVLLALGRQPNTSVEGLTDVGVRLNPDGTIEHDELMRTRVPNIYVCGDVAGPFQFTHVAAHQAWYAAVNALFSPFKTFRADYRVIPWATFTDPEIARVGLNESEARAKRIAYEVTTYGIDDLDRAIADGAEHGFVKVLTPPGKDRILGATIVGAHASELLAEFVLAMKHGIGLNKILGTIHTYPTMSEAAKFAAGNWKKAHKPERLLDWIGRFHAWVRGT